MTYVDFKLCNIIRDKLKKPKWADKINRWHQLDDESFAVAQATYENQGIIKNPDIIFFTASDGSTHTDCLFTMSDKFSPSNFVHTLPNVRALSFSLVRDWEGPMVCTSNGHESYVETIEHAYCYLQGSENKKNAIIVNVSRDQNSLLVDLCQMSKEYEYRWYLEEKKNDNVFNGFDSNFRENIFKNIDLNLKNLVLRKN